MSTQDLNNNHSHNIGNQAEIYDLQTGILEGYAQLTAGNYRKRPMSGIIERAEQEMHEEDNS